MRGSTRWSLTAAALALGPLAPIAAGTAWRPHSPADHITHVGPEHPTSGLPGYPARDYFARAGSRVLSPIRGVVVELSGHDPSTGPRGGPHGPFGWSVYIARGGRTFFLTHLGTRHVHVGQQLQRGEAIGTVGDYARWGGADHVHVGVHVARCVGADDCPNSG